MSDTAPRNPTGAPQMLADALLRSVSGTSALLRVTGPSAGSSQLEIGIAATAFSDVIVGPVVRRKLGPTWEEGGQSKWELLISATGVEQQVHTLGLASADALFAMTLAVTVGGQVYIIESTAASEAFGHAYLYRLLVREARPQGV
jgi:hypothetical protein